MIGSKGASTTNRSLILSLDRSAKEILKTKSTRKNPCHAVAVIAIYAFVAVPIA